MVVISESPASDKQQALNECRLKRGVVPGSALPAVPILLTCKTPAFVGASGGTAPPPGAQQPCPRVPRTRAARPRPPPPACSVAAPPPRLPGRSQPRPCWALRRPTPPPSVAAFFPRLLRPFGVPAKVQSPFLLGPGTRGREGGERRVPHFPLDAGAQTTGAMRRWALRLGKAAGILPRPGVFSVGVGVLRRACWGAPRTAGTGAGAEQEPGWRPRSCIRCRCCAAECHLRDTCQPAGSRRRAPPHPASSVPGTEGASPAQQAGG